MKSIAALFFASVFAAAALAAESDVNLDKGQEMYNQVCLACHGEGGNSTVALQPSLAQQFPQYLVKQLHEFKNGKRQDDIMVGFASMLSDEDMQNISAWLNQQKAEPGFARDESLALEGERIYRGGLPDRHIPACMACHSPNGAGIPAQYPHLAGQHYEYTVKTLKDFRSGGRANNNIMKDVAAHMSDREIEAVSDYIAGLR